MLNKIIHLLIFTIIVATQTACINYKYAKKNTFSEREGKRYLGNQKIDVTFGFYGDYRFHKPSKRKHHALNKEFYNAIMKAENAHVFYESHTIIDPFGSSVGIFYPNIQLADFNQFDGVPLTKQKLLDDTLHYNGILILRSIFMIDEIQYIDYLFESNNGICRIHFWSANPNRIWLNNESKGIIETVNEVFER